MGQDVLLGFSIDEYKQLFTDRFISSLVGNTGIFKKNVFKILSIFNKLSSFTGLILLF